jgi:hypothetical protein
VRTPAAVTHSTRRFEDDFIHTHDTDTLITAKGKRVAVIAQMAQNMHPMGLGARAQPGALPLSPAPGSGSYYGGPLGGAYQPTQYGAPPSPASQQRAVGGYGAGGEYYHGASSYGAAGSPHHMSSDPALSAPAHAEMMAAYGAPSGYASPAHYGPSTGGGYAGAIVPAPHFGSASFQHQHHHQHGQHGAPQPPSSPAMRAQVESEVTRATLDKARQLQDLLRQHSAAGNPKPLAHARVGVAGGVDQKGAPASNGAGVHAVSPPRTERLEAPETPGSAAYARGRGASGTVPSTPDDSARARARARTEAAERDRAAVRAAAASASGAGSATSATVVAPTMQQHGGWNPTSAAFMAQVASPMGAAPGGQHQHMPQPGMGGHGAGVYGAQHMEHMAYTGAQYPGGVGRPGTSISISSTHGPSIAAAREALAAETAALDAALRAEMAAQTFH